MRDYSYVWHRVTNLNLNVKNYMRASTSTKIQEKFIHSWFQKLLEISYCDELFIVINIGNQCTVFVHFILTQTSFRFYNPEQLFETVWKVKIALVSRCLGKVES